VAFCGHKSKTAASGNGRDVVNLKEFGVWVVSTARVDGKWASYKILGI
jgi:hypothetical protein